MPTWLHIPGCLALGEWSHHHDYLGREDLFLCSSSVYSCHLFLISSAPAYSIPFLSFIVLIFAWNVPLVSLIFLKSSLGIPILFFPSISLHCSLNQILFSLLAFFGTLHSVGNTFFLYHCPLLLFFSLLFVKPSQTPILPSCISFSLA